MVATKDYLDTTSLKKVTRFVDRRFVLDTTTATSGAFKPGAESLAVATAPWATVAGSVMDGRTLKAADHGNEIAPRQT